MKRISCSCIEWLPIWINSFVHNNPLLIPLISIGWLFKYYAVLMGGAQSGLIYPPKIHPSHQSQQSQIRGSTTDRFGKLFNSIGFPFVIGELIEEALRPSIQHSHARSPIQDLGASGENDANNLVLRRRSVSNGFPCNHYDNRTTRLLCVTSWRQSNLGTKSSGTRLLQAMNTQFS
ncbi:unnamed protein product, partial [Mesorhabditis belari]|uniref:Uncharacterized protein n=1 Tax=Mesorhabditis belari TaxID=2138241 RepID=A0AAF3FMF8_9BILA